jgi:hypothetical protein
MGIQLPEKYKENFDVSRIARLRREVEVLCSPCSGSLLYIPDINDQSFLCMVYLYMEDVTWKGLNGPLIFVCVRSQMEECVLFRSTITE